MGHKHDCTCRKSGYRYINFLPGIHAFTGHDSTAAFMLKGENYPFQVMVKNNDFVLSFGRFGESSIRVSLIPLMNLSVQCTI